ncbi:kinase [Phenylobacterium soli]|uniref:Kinase n=1 Tax=Phenylobacterium soli TaxID=2170551 RepID=A0A328AL46_9CAUL|nr:kinase [Phenylobacterium soli]RAK55277.1 kinase [Phenylobacterium soli]
MAWLDDFLAAEGLPDRYRETVERVARPLAATAAEARRANGRSVVVGICGAQGSGKSTLAMAVKALLAEDGLSAAVLSLDDLYLPRAERARLAHEVHPLLITRGPPGTHDPALGVATLAALARAGPVPLPRFDKAADERRPAADWDVAQGPVDVVLFEGWCVGARPQPQEALAAPVNALERDEDPDGRWRGFVNTALAGAYAPLFARLDRLALLAAPGFETVAAWREEQEAKLRERTGGGMAPGQIGRFVAHYERLTRWILEEMPPRADAVFRLAADRTPT